MYVQSYANMDYIIFVCYFIVRYCMNYYFFYINISCYILNYILFTGCSIFVHPIFCTILKYIADHLAKLWNEVRVNFVTKF